ncbi:MAG: hypothetical protein RIC55_03955 [Pirellulaceae bacterium]
MNVTFQLEGGPWDGQVISTSADCEVTADFARVLFLCSHGAPVGAELSLVSPAGRDQIEAEGRHEARADGVRPHAYCVSERREVRGRVTIRATHAGQKTD